MHHLTSRSPREATPGPHSDHQVQEEREENAARGMAPPLLRNDETRNSFSVSSFERWVPFVACHPGIGIPTLLFVLTLLQPIAAHSEPMVSVFLELDGPSVAEVNLMVRPGARLAGARALGDTRRVAIQTQHADLEGAIAGVGAKLTGRFTTVLNALRALVPESRIPGLASLPGVKRVQRAHLYRRQFISSVPYIGVPAVWSRVAGNTHLTGEGVRIGIIDSGIDYQHADFGGSGQAADYARNNSNTIEPGSFPTAKVVGGWDFVGDAYNPENPAQSVPVPDPDPLDPDGHGSHVAGIAAGFGVKKDGTTYFGPYHQVDFTQFAISPGVAPKALLYALKVFGSTGAFSSDALVDALDWAADPNADGNTSDRLDVAVISLGGYGNVFGQDDPGALELKAVDQLARLGTVVAVPAGNQGNSSYILSSPGVAPRAVTVASSYADHANDIAMEITGPAHLAGKYLAREASFTPQLADVGSVSGELVAAEPFDACLPLANVGAFQGKIALIYGTACVSSNLIQGNGPARLRESQEAGAIAAVFVHHSDVPTLNGVVYVGRPSDIRIPAVVVSQADGTRFRAALATGGVHLKLAADLSFRRENDADSLHGVSSRGPSFRSSRLKPDVAAPGYAVSSVLAGSGVKATNYSGTSTAAPHVGGAAALLKQAHPTWSAEDIKAALMNTAIATRDHDGTPYPESWAGAGRIRVDRAALTEVVAKADGGDGEVSISFGAFELTAPLATNRAVRVVNHGTTPVTLRLSATNTTGGTGVMLTPMVKALVVPAQGSAVFQVTLAADPARLADLRDPLGVDTRERFPNQQLPEASGEIWLQGDGVALHLPWYTVIRATAHFAATAPNIGSPTGQVSQVSLPTRGASGHSTPLVSVFQLGGLHPNQKHPDYRASTDLVAFGVATDRLTSGSISNTTLYFGLATAGHWVTPQLGANGFMVEIDLNSDGGPEYTVFNGNTATYGDRDLFSLSRSTDALISVVQDEATGDLTAEWPINKLEPKVRDTSPFLNGVMVHAVRAADLGLTDARSSFRYRMVTLDYYWNDADVSSWIAFNAARPLVDATPLGIDGTPFFDEGREVLANLHREYAGSATAARVLLLHQHNVAGSQYDVVTVDLSTPDSDGDGLEDGWELRKFGDLSYGPADDPDGDGVRNSLELSSGTDPNKVRLLAPGAIDAPLRWASRGGRFYTIERADNVNGPFRPVQRHVNAVEGINTFRDPALATPHGPYFYRLRLE